MFLDSKWQNACDIQQELCGLMGGCDQLELEQSCNGADGPGGLGSIGREKGKEKSKEWEKCEQRSGGKN